MGPGQDQTRDSWISSQTSICCETCYRLRYVARYILLYILFLLSVDFFQNQQKNQLCEKFFQKYNKSCQTIWIQIRPDILSGLIWVQNICKGYQQMKLEGEELNMDLVRRKPSCFQNSQPQVRPQLQRLARLFIL